MRSPGYRGTPSRSPHHTAVFGTPAAVHIRTPARSTANVRGPTSRQLVQFTFVALLIVVVWNSLSAVQAPVYRNRSYLEAGHSSARKRPRDDAPAAALAPPHAAVHAPPPNVAESHLDRAQAPASTTPAQQQSAATAPKLGMVSDGHGGWVHP